MEKIEMRLDVRRDEIKWLKDNGATVVAEEVIAELVSDKAYVTLHAPAPGVLTIMEAPGDLIAIIHDGACCPGCGNSRKDAIVFEDTKCRHCYNYMEWQ